MTDAPSTHPSFLIRLRDPSDERAWAEFLEIYGIPLRLTCGKTVAEGQVELSIRATGEKRLVPLESAMAEMKKLVDEAIAATMPKEAVGV